MRSQLSVKSDKTNINLFTNVFVLEYSYLFHKTVTCVDINVSILFFFLTNKKMLKEVLALNSQNSNIDRYNL